MWQQLQYRMFEMSASNSAYGRFGQADVAVPLTTPHADSLLFFRNLRQVPIPDSSSKISFRNCLWSGMKVETHCRSRSASSIPSAQKSAVCFPARRLFPALSLCWCTRRKTPASLKPCHHGWSWEDCPSLVAGQGAQAEAPPGRPVARSPSRGVAAARGRRGTVPPGAARRRRRSGARWAAKVSPSGPGGMEPRNTSPCQKACRFGWRNTGNLWPAKALLSPQGCRHRYTRRNTVSAVLIPVLTSETFDGAKRCTLLVPNGFIPGEIVSHWRCVAPCRASHGTAHCLSHEQLRYFVFSVSPSRFWPFHIPPWWWLY